MHKMNRSPNSPRSTVTKTVVASILCSFSQISEMSQYTLGLCQDEDEMIEKLLTVLKLKTKISQLIFVFKIS